MYIFPKMFIHLHIHGCPKSESYSLIDSITDQRYIFFSIYYDVMITFNIKGAPLDSLLPCLIRHIQVEVSNTQVICSIIEQPSMGCGGNLKIFAFVLKTIKITDTLGDQLIPLKAFHSVSLTFVATVIFKFNCKFIIASRIISFTHIDHNALQRSLSR